MPESFLFILLLIAFVIAYIKLKTANSNLKEQLRNLEERFDQFNTTPLSKPVAKTETQSPLPKSPSPLTEAQSNQPATAAKSKKPEKTSQVTPPPLPSLAKAKKKTSSASPATLEAPVAKEATAKPAAPNPSSPSFFERIPWRDILERLHLWPPSKSEAGENAEFQLASWWTLRAGLVVVIIGAVFGGIHVSQHTPPILRVLALFLVSCSTIFIGTRMKDKMEGFGRGIIAGGFALLYFTAFAAFALPATKVIGSPTLGILAQLTALLVTITWSLWKKDQSVATLTLLLGYVSCGFSHSNNLDHFTFIGLVLFAATGTFLFAQRGWLTTFITSLAGSWLGFALFTLLDWRGDDAPAFYTLLGILVILTVLFEAANLVGIARQVHPLSDRWRRWLILSNTTAAAILGYGFTRVIYADQLSTFYFVFAFLYLAITAIHHFRSTDEALTQTLFLKTSALLCLGFAAAFDGPVRWLAIAFQSFALLWTAKRSQSRWIALGFAVVFAASLSWFWRDLLMRSKDPWLWLETVRIAGSFYLVFLTAQLSLHSLWFPSGIGGITPKHNNQSRIARLIGSLAIGISAIVFALHPFTLKASDPLWFMLILASLIAAVCPAMRRVTPCVAAAPPLLFIYFAYPFLSPRISQSTGALLLGITLIVISFAIAELIRRYWPRKINGAPSSRGFTLLAGLVTLWPFTHALVDRLSISPNAAIGVFALIPIIATAALLSRYQLIHDGTRSRAITGFYIATGLIVFIGGLITCQKSDFFSSALTLASLPLLATLFSIRSGKAALAGTIPLLGGYLILWIDLLGNRPDNFTHDSINLAFTLMVSIGIAVILWKKIHTPSLLKLAMYSEVALLGLTLFSIHLFFQKHLLQGADFFASALLGIALLLISRRFPFRSLTSISWLPITLAFFTGILNGMVWGVANAQHWLWLGGLIVLAQLLLSAHWMQKGEQSVSAFMTDTLRFRFQPLISLIAVLSWTLVVYSAAATPWQATGLTGIALLSSSLWRWKKIEAMEIAALVIPLSLSALISILVLALPNPSSSPTHDLISVLLVAIGITAHGILLATAHQQSNQITSSKTLPWLHAGTALFIAFAACATDRLVSGNLTSVFWGVSAITLFVSGLFAGQRAYRLVGLVGLLFCILRIFVLDIQDNLYRIFAFLAIGLLLLVIGYLYHRFRDRIASLDQSGE